MENKPIPVMLTILCYAYNHEKYIRQTLEGFVSQKTGFRFKVLVHDDASTDATASIIKEIASQYPDIIQPILQKQNTYRTIGAKQRFSQYIQPNLEGKYIAHCEGDDYWCDEHKLERQVAFLEMNPEYSACVHNSYFLDMNTNQKCAFNPNETTEMDFDINDLIGGVYQKYHNSSLVYRLEYLNIRPPYFDGIGFTDYPRAIQLITGGKIHYFAEKMSVYRFCSNPTSWTANNTGLKNFKKRISVLEKEINMLLGVKKEHPQYTNIIDETIKGKRYDSLYLSGDSKSIKSDTAFREIYCKESFMRKIKFHIRKAVLFFTRNKD